MREIRNLENSKRRKRQSQQILNKTISRAKVSTNSILRKAKRRDSRKSDMRRDSRKSDMRSQFGGETNIPEELSVYDDMKSLAHPQYGPYSNFSREDESIGEDIDDMEDD